MEAATVQLRIAASIRASRKESVLQQIGLGSLQLPVPLGQAQRKPKKTFVPN